MSSGRISFISEHPGYNFSFSPNLYNLPEHLELLPSNSLQSFYMVDNQRKQIVGCVHFSIQAAVAESLPRRPFGFFEFDDRTGYNRIHDFVKYVMGALAFAGVSRIVLKGYPGIYSEKTWSKCTYALASNGFHIEKSGINHHIATGDNEYRSVIDRQEVKRLNKCVRKGLVFSKEPVSALWEVFGFICRWREEKNFEVNITIKELEESFSRFPGRYNLFAARDEGQLVAASISVIVNNEILYDFMHASPLSARRFSPVVFLLNGIYAYCRGQGVKFIDLGGSEAHGKPVRSLIRFKENIGGIPSVKLTFIKNL